jgi:hypothetical protein
MTSPDSPATPTQMAASGPAAADAVEPDPTPISGPVERLLALLQAVRARHTAWTALWEVGAAPGQLARAWIDLHAAHAETLAAALVALDVTPDAGPPAVGAAMRAVASRAGIRSLQAELWAENRVIDRYTDMARVDPEHRALLDRHRAAIVRLANRTQDAIER